VGEKWPMNFACSARLPRNIQGSFTCRKSTTWDRRLYFPSEGRRAEDRPITYSSLTRWSGVLHENVNGFKLVKKLPAFYGTQRFITAFTNASQSISPDPRWTFVFRNYSSFYGEELSAPCKTPKLENHHLSAVHECLFKIFATTLIVGSLSSATRVLAMSW
jgi:hypothetical protein